MSVCRSLSLSVSLSVSPSHCLTFCLLLSPCVFGFACGFIQSIEKAEIGLLDLTKCRLKKVVCESERERERQTYRKTDMDRYTDRYRLTDRDRQIETYINR